MIHAAAGPIGRPRRQVAMAWRAAQTRPGLAARVRSFSREIER
ncbi:hypothetical protein [Lysobacter gummosus]